MTRKEKELKALEALGLKVGDKIIFTLSRNVYEIKEDDRMTWLHKTIQSFDETIYLLFEYDWEKIEKPLKYKKCKDFDGCKDCPFANKRFINCYNIIKNTADEDKTLEQIYHFFESTTDSLKTEIFCGDE